MGKITLDYTLLNKTVITGSWSDRWANIRRIRACTRRNARISIRGVYFHFSICRSIPLTWFLEQENPAKTYFYDSVEITFHTKMERTLIEFRVEAPVARSTHRTTTHCQKMRVGDVQRKKNVSSTWASTIESAICWKIDRLHPLAVQGEVATGKPR